MTSSKLFALPSLSLPPPQIQNLFVHHLYFGSQLVAFSSGQTNIFKFIRSDPLKFLLNCSRYWCLNFQDFNFMGLAKTSSCRWARVESCLRVSLFIAVVSGLANVRVSTINHAGCVGRQAAEPATMEVFPLSTFIKHKLKVPRRPQTHSVNAAASTSSHQAAKKLFPGCKPIHLYQPWQ
ncbi:hypothetical protein K438DRAFT_1784863 [Mycena galopus ATCC 62051]|nr:hypothetical protein K438DRAFT_1784863 [Mycena galopus ATCC 62051]